MRVRNLSWGTLAIVVVLASGCGSSTTPGHDGGGGSSGGGAAGSAGTTGGAGTSGAAGASGSAGVSGNAGTTGRGGTTGSGGSGTQPIGAACANSTNCSQADGTAVCCLAISTCVLDGQCPGSPTYVSCETTPCAKAGWVCCNAGGMHFCTKQSGCP